MGDEFKDDEKTPLLASDVGNGNLPASSADVIKGDGKKEPEEKRRAATFGELFSLATGLDRTLIFVAILAAMATGSAWPVMFLIFGDMTNDFVGYESNDTNSTNGSSYIDPNEFEDRMTDYALRYIYIGLGVCVATYTQMAFLQVACERQTYKLRTVFFKALLRQNIGWYDKQQSGELTTRLADDLERIHEGTGDKIGLTFQMLAQFVAGFVVGFAKGWKMTLVIMSVSPLLAIFGAVIGKIMTSFAAMEQQKYGKAGAIAEEVLSCIRTVTSFNGQTQEIKKYGRALQESMRIGIKKGFITGLSVGLTMLVMFGAYGLGFWFGSTQVDDYYNSNGDDGLAPGEVLTVFFGVMVGSFALGGASPHLTLVLTAKGAAGTIFSIIKDNPIINSSSEGGKRPESIQSYIQLKNVQFSYPSRKEVKVLKNFTLDIQPGQTVALVGASGCGKSTIVNLIQRFYDPDEGQILLDGNDVRDLNIHWLRQRIGVVSQEPILFGMSIAKNIELGKPGISEEQIVEAAKMANAHDFISNLPNGYDTLVGERGAQLSGGQKQRVAIARALVRDPRILLLDEATSALDSESEGIVQSALDKARQGRTTVVIAHRLSTIQNADVIYVLEGGELVEKGKHGELMALKGVYYKLVTLQTITRHDGEEEGEDEEVIEEEESDNPELSPGRHTTLSKKELTKRQTSTLSTHSTESPKKTFTLFKSKKEEETEEDKDIPRPSFVQMFKANMKELPAIIFGCFGAIINGSIFPVFAVFFSEIIKTFSKRGQELLDDGLLWSMLFVGLGGISFVANIIQSGAFALSGEKLTRRLREQSFSNIVRQDMSYFDDPKHSTGALTTRLAVDASLVRTATGYRVAIVIQSFTSVIAGLTIAFVYGWKLALAILGGVPLIMLSGRINMKLVKGNQARDSALMEAAGKTASECIENIRTVQSLTREPFFYEVYCQELLKPYKENVKQAHIYGISYAFSQSLLFFIYAAAFRFGAWLVVHDDMDPSLVFRVFFAIAFTGMSVGQASSFLPEFSKAQLSAGHIFSILALVPKIDIFSSLGIKKSVIGGQIEVKDIHFRYPMRPDVEVLKGVSLSVQPGQTAALVGMSGCGKSTIVSLVQRYYDPEAGSILVDGTDIKDYNLHSLRSIMSVVSQEPILFDTSIRENICYGLDTETSMADVIAAAKTANAHEFISRLPDGYETSVGEKGTQLSGGQKQRVAIARALIRNPKILLLDEATSALDTESEKVVQDALDKAREGRTCIVIAHRLSTIQNADVIYVIDDGQVVESDTHQKLLAKKGAYSVLVGGQQFKKGDATAIQKE